MASLPLESSVLKRPIHSPSLPHRRGTAVEIDTLELARRILHYVAMSTVGIYEAKKNFSKLLRRAATGEEIVITRSREPIARLVSIGSHEQRQIGMDAGVFEVREDFDEVAEAQIGEWIQR